MPTTTTRSITMFNLQEIEAALKTAAGEHGHPVNDETKAVLKPQVQEGVVINITAEVETVGGSVQPPVEVPPHTPREESNPPEIVTVPS